MIPKRLLRRTTIEQLRKAIALKLKLDRAESLERQRDRLQRQLARLDRKIARLNGSGSTTTAAKPGGKPGRRKGFKLSAATRRKMSEAAKRRYAGKGNAAAPALGKKRRSMSPETRQKMAEAARRRWTKVKGTVPAE